MKTTSYIVFFPGWSRYCSNILRCWSCSIFPFHCKAKSPFAMSHASTVAQLPGGNRMAGGSGGTAESKPDGDLDIAYTWNRKSIMYVRFPPADVSK